LVCVVLNVAHSVNSLRLHVSAEGTLTLLAGDKTTQGYQDGDALASARFMELDSCTTVPVLDSDDDIYLLDVVCFSAVPVVPVPG
jgi:hypothetical protein